MNITLQLFGIYRRFCDLDAINLSCPEGARISDVKAALGVYAAAHWAGWDAGILHFTVLATSKTLLRDSDQVPSDGQLAILPPVSGG